MKARVLAVEQVRAENEELRARLAEAEETLRAIREGEVDAVIVSGSRGDLVFALSEAENLHRLMIETMNESGLAITPDGLLVYCNDRTCAVLERSRDQLLGQSLDRFVAPLDAGRFRQLIASAHKATSDARIEFLTAAGKSVPLHIWASYLDRAGEPLFCLVATDLSRVEADRKLIAQLHQQREQLNAARVAALNLVQDAVAARRQAEQAAAELRASEQRMQQALRVSHSFTFEWRPATDHVLRSASCATILGLAGDEACNDTGQRFFQRLHPDDRARLVQMLGELTPAASSYSTEYRVVRGDGSEAVLEEAGQATFDAAGNLERLVGVSTDITARKRAEEEARGLEAIVARERDRLAALLSSITDEIWFADTAGKFTLVNPAGASEFALDPRGTTDVRALAAQLEVFRPDGSPRPVEEAPPLRAIRGEVVRNHEEIIRTPASGALRYRQITSSPVRDAGGSIMGSVSVIRDITSLKKAEEALRASESFHRQTLESIPGMVFTTRPDGYCDYQSQQWVDYTGVPMEQHLGDGWNRLQHPDDRPRSYAAWRAAVEGRAPYDLEYRVRRHDGVYEWFKVIARPIRDESGQIVRWFGVALNIEALKQAEDALRASLQEKDVLLKEIHHRVKNNMQVLLSLVSLQADGARGAAAQGLFADMRDRIRSMALVHERLYQSENLAQVDFPDYARRLLEQLLRAHGPAETTVRPRLELEPVLLTVETAVPCGLILNELASNALKHAFGGRKEGEISVATRTEADGRVTLRVSDNGVGLPEGVDWRQARSLGLRLVTMLAKQLEGTVEVRSGKDNGTSFEVSFRPAGAERDGAAKRE
jgi:PAS domain S-box-containing protein